jgi:hypothetical protein
MIVGLLDEVPEVVLVPLEVVVVSVEVLLVLVELLVDVFVEVGLFVIVYPDQRVASQASRWLTMLAEIDLRTESANVGCGPSMKLLVMVEYIPVVLIVVVVVDAVTEHPWVGAQFV